MFDWLKNLLFDEEEVVIEEDSLDRIDFNKVQDIENVIKPTVSKDIKEVQEVKKEGVNEVKGEEPKKVEDAVSFRKDLNIQVVEAEKEKEVVSKKNERADRNDRPLRKEKEIEIEQVLSPMFGGGEMKVVKNRTQKEVAPKKKDGLGTVISPIYGQEELNMHEKEAIQKIEEEKKDDLPLFDEEWKDDIPLEELITNEEENDDCVQFSLFGDSINQK